MTTPPPGGGIPPGKDHMNTNPAPAWAPDLPPVRDLLDQEDWDLIEDPDVWNDATETTDLYDLRSELLEIADPIYDELRYLNEHMATLSKNQAAIVAPAVTAQRGELNMAARRIQSRLTQLSGEIAKRAQKSHRTDSRDLMELAVLIVSGATNDELVAFLEQVPVLELKRRTNVAVRAREIAAKRSRQREDTLDEKIAEHEPSKMGRALGVAAAEAAWADRARAKAATAETVRDDAVRLAVEAGNSMYAVAAATGLSRTRVQQIMRKQQQDRQEEEDHR